MQVTQGILSAFDAQGKVLMKHSLMEEFGRLTFPNSRTASPVIDQDLVITRGITANWGRRDRRPIGFMPSIRRRVSWSGLRVREIGPRTILIRIHISAGSAGSGYFIAPPAM